MPVMSPAKKKTGTAKLRTWRVSILRNRVQFLGFVEAPNSSSGRSRSREEIQHQRGTAHAVGRAGAGLAGAISPLRNGEASRSRFA
jgi:hypothetical protein